MDDMKYTYKGVNENQVEVDEDFSVLVEFENIGKYDISVNYVQAAMSKEDYVDDVKQSLEFEIPNTTALYSGYNLYSVDTNGNALPHPETSRQSLPFTLAANEKVIKSIPMIANFVKTPPGKLAFILRVDSQVVHSGNTDVSKLGDINIRKD